MSIPDAESSQVLDQTNLEVKMESDDKDFTSLAGKLRGEIESHSDASELVKNEVDDQSSVEHNFKNSPCGLSEADTASTGTEGDDSDALLDLFVTFLPLDWSQKLIKMFVDKECGKVKKINIATENNREFTGTLRLEYDTREECVKIRDVINGKEVEGLRIHAVCVKRAPDSSLDESDSCNDSSEPPAKKLKIESTPPIDNIEDDDDPTGLYGLKAEYLKSLDITPPLSKWVHISNFRCDKWELKDALEIAGKVVVCKVTHGVKKFAKVMFSHPLEAVQAISMLHNQSFYGMSLHISMEHVPLDFTMMPNGLASIGPGLGASGTPLADIPKHYQKHLKGANNGLNKMIFNTREEIYKNISAEKSNGSQKPNDIVSGPLTIPLSVSKSMANNNSNVNRKPGKVSPIQTPIPTISPTNKPHFNNSKSIVPFNTPRSQVPWGPRPPFSGQQQWNNVPAMYQGPGNTTAGPRPMGPMSAMPGPTNPRPMGSMQSGFLSVELTNLPLSTSFPQLSEKMASVGPVMSLQLTGPGCALIKFSHPSFADKCFHMYNNVNIMGNIIRARMV